jgi:ABC-type proline/glycine betaine transport system ATPase subunit
VMEGGSIVQQGQLAELASRPATDFVSRFVGPPPSPAADRADEPPGQPS